MRYSHIYIIYTVYTIQLYSGYTTILNHKKSPVIYLVGGLEHFSFSINNTSGNPSQLTFIFFKMAKTTNQTILSPVIQYGYYIHIKSINFNHIKSILTIKNHHGYVHQLICYKHG